MAGIGGAAAALLGWMVFRVMDRGISTAAMAFMGVKEEIAVLCLSAGLRLALNRPNRYRSALPPLAWFALGSFFLGTSVMMAGFSKYTDIPASFGAFVFGCLCFRAGKDARDAGSSRMPGAKNP